MSATQLADQYGCKTNQRLHEAYFTAVDYGYTAGYKIFAGNTLQPSRSSLPTASRLIPKSSTTDTTAGSFLSVIQIAVATHHVSDKTHPGIDF